MSTSEFGVYHRKGTTLLNNINYCHNLAVRRLMIWYEDVLKHKDLIASVVNLIKNESTEDTIKKDVLIYLTKYFDSLAFDKFMSETVNRVLNELNNYAKEGRNDMLLRFEPYYARYDDDQ